MAGEGSIPDSVPGPSARVLGESSKAAHCASKASLHSICCIDMRRADNRSVNSIVALPCGEHVASMGQYTVCRK